MAGKREEKDRTDDLLFDQIEIRQKVFRDNVSRLYVVKYASQIQFADDLHIPPSTLNKYLSGEGRPTLEFALRCSALFQMSLDELFRTPGEKAGPYHDLFAVSKGTAPYLGHYLLYYFDTSGAGGGGFGAETLSHAVLSIYIGEDGEAKVCALMHLSGQEAGNCLDALKGVEDVPALYEQLEEGYASATPYRGNLHVSTGFAYCAFLTTKSGRDLATLMLRDPKSGGGKSEEKQDYIGGIGALLSASRGEEAMPCIQLAVLSRIPLHDAVSEEEIARALLLEAPELNLKDHVGEIVDLVKQLYIPEKEGGVQLSGLEEHQKRLLIQDKLESLLGLLLEQNVFRLCKISAKDDGKVYHFIKAAKGDGKGRADHAKE